MKRLFIIYSITVWGILSGCETPSKPSPTSEEPEVVTTVSYDDRFLDAMTAEFGDFYIAPSFAKTYLLDGGIRITMLAMDSLKLNRAVNNAAINNLSNFKSWKKLNKFKTTTKCDGQLVRVEGVFDMMDYMIKVGDIMKTTCDISVVQDSFELSLWSYSEVRSGRLKGCSYYVIDFKKDTLQDTLYRREVRLMEQSMKERLAENSEILEKVASKNGTIISLQAAKGNQEHFDKIWQVMFGVLDTTPEHHTNTERQ